MAQRFACRNICAAAFQYHDTFDLVMHVRRQRRVGEILACGQEIVRVFLEIKGWLTRGIMAHLDGVIGIIAADAIDPADRKADEAAGNRQQHGKRWGDDCFHDRPVLGVRLIATDRKSTARVLCARCWPISVPARRERIRTLLHKSANRNRSAEKLGTRIEEEDFG